MSGPVQSSPSPPSPGSHIPILDGIRGLAVALVMVHHFFADSLPAETAFDHAIFSAMHTGWCGVDLFFVLSGYLITGILYDTKGGRNYFQNFYARRTVRIFPLYYATLFLFFVLMPLVDHPEIQDYVREAEPDQLWFWAYLTNVQVALRGSFYPELIPNLTWSLAIEEQFYLVWPLVVLLASRRTVMRICIGLVVVALGLRVALAANGTKWVVAYVFTPARLDCLAIGAFLALYFRGSYRPNVVVLAKRTLLLCLILVSAFAAHAGTLDQRNPLIYTLGFTGIALCFGSMLVLAVTAPRDKPHGTSARRLVDNGFMRTLGKYSYALYLCHGPVATGVRLLYHPRRQPLYFGSSIPRTLIYVGLTVLASLAVALLSWHLLEKHFLKLKRFFPSERAATPEEERRAAGLTPALDPPRQAGD